MDRRTGLQQVSQVRKRRERQVKGGHARSGPAPDPQAFRRERDFAEWLRLPAAGRDGDPPAWPLTRPLARETKLWDGLWGKPQALVWERLGQHVEVALYVRRLVEVEKRGAAVNRSTLVRQMADSLGLTTPGLRSNRWLIVDETPVRPAAPRSSSRSRLKVVSDDGDAG